MQSPHFASRALRSVAHTLTAATLLAFTSCGDTPGTSTQAVEEDCCAEDLASLPLPWTSIYQLESQWADQTGTQVPLRRFRGKPVVMAMIFTTCEYACPQILADLKTIESQLDKKQREAIQFVLVTFDTERDLPPVLSNYARAQELDPRRWTLLHGASPDVRELAAVLGVQYKKSEAIGFSHSNSISLLGPKGRILHQQKGLGTSSKDLMAAIEKTQR